MLMQDNLMNDRMDNHPPRTYAHLKLRSKQKLVQEERYRVISRDNANLAYRMMNIKGRLSEPFMHETKMSMNE